MSKRPHRSHDSRYSSYTGGPDPLAPPVDLREALEQIGQDVMEGASPRRALQELLRRGNKNLKGADRLAAEVNRRRRELLQRNNLDGTLQEIKKLLDQPDTAKALFDAGVEPSYAGPDATSKLLVSELGKWGKVIKDLGMKID
jgi:uncharacterized protein with von Willebrand factor type A (vWA) domain